MAVLAVRHSWFSPVVPEQDAVLSPVLLSGTARLRPTPRTLGPAPHASGHQRGGAHCPVHSYVLSPLVVAVLPLPNRASDPARASRLRRF